MQCVMKKLTFVIFISGRRVQAKYDLLIIAITTMCNMTCVLQVPTEETLIILAEMLEQSLRKEAPEYVFQGQNPYLEESAGEELVQRGVEALQRGAALAAERVTRLERCAALCAK